MSKQPRQIKANKKADITRQDELSASETTNSQPIGNESMNSLTVLNHEIHQVESLYSLNDLHKASGGQDKHRPAFFVRNQEVKELANEIMQCANLHSDQVIRKVNGGHNRGTYACKEIVYRYAMWISPKFALAVIRVFDAYVTGKLQPQNKGQAKTTVADRVPLKDAVNVLVAKSSLNYSDAYKMVHQFMGVDSIDQIPLDDLPKAVAYVHSLTLVANNSQSANQVDKELYGILHAAVSSHHQLHRMTKSLAVTLHVRDTIDYQLRSLREDIIRTVEFANKQNLYNKLGLPLVSHDARLNAWDGASWSIAVTA